MGRFKVGDKVIPSKQMREQCEVSEWFERVKDKVKDDGYMVISQIYGNSAYQMKGLPSVIFREEWLEPYTENIPKVLSTSIYDCNPLISLPEDGPTMRDEFAMAALKGLLSSGKDCVITEPSSLARVVYSIADAMMEVRHGDTVQQ